MDVPIAEESIYDIALTNLALGLLPACIPITKDGDQGVFMFSGTLDPSVIKDDRDVLALVFVAINRTRREARECGAIPV